MKYGLEKEYFVTNDKDELVLCPKDIPHDGCGFLAEARGEPHEDIVDAVFSLKASEHKLKMQMKEVGLILVDKPVMVIPKQLKLKAQREYAKGLTKHQNLYKFQSHRQKVSEHTAGVHISFTQPKRVYHDSKVVETVNELWDFVQLFKELDVRFKNDIKLAKRNPGFYEIKNDCRIEYRSLPNSINLFNLINAIKEI